MMVMMMMTMMEVAGGDKDKHRDNCDDSDADGDCAESEATIMILSLRSSAERSSVRDDVRTALATAQDSAVLNDRAQRRYTTLSRCSAAAFII